MTVTPSSDRTFRSLPVTLAQTLAASCNAVGATVNSMTPLCELGVWFAGVPVREASVEYELGSNARLVLYGAQREPAPEAIRLASLAMGMWLTTRAQRAATTRLLKQARATFEINRSICGLGGLDRLLLLVAERSRDLLHCEVAGFALLDDCGTTITWRSMSGARTETYRNAIFSPSGGVAGRAISTHHPVVVDDFRLDPTLTPEANPISFAEGLQSVLAVPLDISQRARGCLMIGYRKPHKFSSEELDVLTRFASQAAIAIENAELYDRVRSERARVASVVESIAEGLVLIDVRGRIALVNRRVEEIFDVSRAAYVGQTFDALLSAFVKRSDTPEIVRTRLVSLIASQLAMVNCDVELTGDPPIVLRFTSFPVYDGDRTMLGRGLLCRDITFEHQVDVMKSDVIAIVSHEIRSPLSSIRGCASALLDTERHRSKRLQKDYLETIDRESARLNDLVGNLTDVSMLDAGVLVLALHDSDPSFLIDRVIARKRRENRVIRLASESKPGFLRFDHRRIEQVLDNLLSNAMKYSQPTSEIDVSVVYSPTEFIVSIRDRGSGIARSLQERVFERFYCIEGPRVKGDGCGLGLYICRGIVEAHSGRIWLESTPGAGTTVSFALPRPQGSA